MEYYELFGLFKDKSRNTWKDEIMKDLVSVDKDNHTCTIKVDGEDYTLDIDIDSFDSDYKCQLKADTFVKDSKGKQYYVPFFSPMDVRADFASNACAIMDKGDRVELVYFDKECVNLLDFKLIYISPDSTEYTKISEKDLDSEFREQLHKWWNGEFVI